MSKAIDAENAVEEHDENIDVGSDVLEMSDEDFMNASEETLAGEPTRLPREDDEPEEEEEEEEKKELGDGHEEVETPAEVNEEEDDANAEANESEQTNADEETNKDQPVDNESEVKIDYEAEYKKLFQPIKASGRMVQMKSTDQIVNRIQLAEDYNKKMHAMRPHMQTLRTLEKQGLLDPEKLERLNLLLEIDNGDTNAIKKLIAESGINLVDLADEEVMESKKQYRPQNHMVSQEEVDVEQAIKDISGSEKYQDTLDVMTQTFDQRSREIISKNPSYIGSLNHDIESGIFNEIMDHVSYRREMNIVPKDMSDIEAYIDTVQALGQQQEEQQKQEQPQDNSQQQSKPRVSKETRRKRNSMSSSQSAPAGRTRKEYDPLTMSDEDFMKISGVSLL